MAGPNLYEILGVPRDASAAQIKNSYRKLVRLYHPDVAPAQHPDRFSEIAQAYEVLRDSGRRARYDRDQAADDSSDTPADGADSREPSSTFDAHGRAGYRRGTPPPTPTAPSSPARPSPAYIPPRRYRRYSGRPVSSRPVSFRPVRSRRGVRWFTVLLSLVAVICGLALAFHLTEPAAATCDPPVPGKVLAPPPGQDAIAWEGQVTLSSRCYIAIDALGGPADDHLPSAGSTPDGLVLAVQGGGYSISFDDEGSLVAGRSAAVKYIGVQTLTSVPARSACLSMARDAPAASFSGPGSSVCVLSNGDHVVYLKITGVHADRLHQVQWITADMIEWQQKAS